MKGDQRHTAGERDKSAQADINDQSGTEIADERCA
jgi:hypothetical protein